MTALDHDMWDIIESAKLAFVATVNQDGSPNLSPKGSLHVYDDDRVAFMDIASPGTIENLARNPRIEIVVIDLLRRRGYRFSGAAEVHSPGSSVHAWLNHWLQDRNGPGYPANHAVVLKIEQVRPVFSPAYTYGAADENTLTAQFSDAYLNTLTPPNDRC
ncbi:pyridoxamine 5'-phosphate oxidase family protein [Mycolicibacterium llatzerense]|uniref:Pyridoxamine 5'-phosphate oxidase n=1 Tax=Mycolicibacterium llatzerense TaxID=280871 RepID=A0A0D1LQB6_9MYCO|nr:pyridoxamine 5'-phosphate oxidase family protein [Mycolicibacterium llatzerense]KIU18281.1 pyridoxamine 5'-phosphate oxidase [Mycolicibacterium llatzerense]MCT7367382.1 pyridoxamine 5'-phosphate oxidase [Mycolicibacterium llatzerense]